MVKVAPSLLSANFACLKDDIEKIEKVYHDVRLTTKHKQKIINFNDVNFIIIKGVILCTLKEMIYNYIIKYINYI